MTIQPSTPLHSPAGDPWSELYPLPPVFVIHCRQEYLLAVLKFANSTNQIEQLMSQFETLASWTKYHPGMFIHLYSDFAPYSFYWTEEFTDGYIGLRGGLIYHGDHDRGGDGGAPTLSVNLSPMQGWHLHT